MTEFYKIFPASLRERMMRISLLEDGFTEVRLRCNTPIILQKGREEFFLHIHTGLTRNEEEALKISVNEIREMMEYISNFSVYAYEDEMRQGFLTIQGGHRVGICGKVVMQDRKIKTIRNISFLNIRLARERKGCADALLPYLFENGRLCHTLIVSPPGCGKTTMLRELIRQLSNGGIIRVSGKMEAEHRGLKVGVVDERSEIAACYHGVPQNDLGMRTDVLDGCPKTIGIELLLRSMSPEVIAVDELGGTEDIAMLKRSIYCGCKIIATAHGEGWKEWFAEDGKEARVSDIPFERYIFLKPEDPPGQIATVCDGTGGVLC